MFDVVTVYKVDYLCSLSLIVFSRDERVRTDWRCSLQRHSGYRSRSSKKQTALLWKEDAAQFSFEHDIVLCSNSTTDEEAMLVQTSEVWKM